MSWHTLQTTGSLVSSCDLVVTKAQKHWSSQTGISTPGTCGNSLFVTLQTWNEKTKIIFLFTPHSPAISLSSIFPQPSPSPVVGACVEAVGFWCCPRQWTIWVISCAPVSYDFVLRQCCSWAFCLAGLSHGSQTSLFLSFPFHVARVNETSPRLLWGDLVIYPLDPMTEGLTCSVNCVSDTTSHSFHRDSLST